MWYCENRQEFLQKYNLQNYDFRQILEYYEKYQDEDSDIAEEYRKILWNYPLDLHERAVLNEYLHNEGVTDVYASYNVINSNSVYSSYTIEDSSEIAGSAAVKNSTFIYHSQQVIGSTNVKNSELVFNSELISNSKDIKYCSYISDSSHCADSHYLSYCNNVENSNYMGECVNIDSSAFCIFCADSSNLLFSTYKKGVSNYIFDMPVDDFTFTYWYNSVLAQSKQRGADTIHVRSERHFLKEFSALLAHLSPKFWKWVLDNVPGATSEKIENLVGQKFDFS